VSKDGFVVKRRVGSMVVASWALATVITGLVVWSAVAVLDDGTRTDVLSGAQVSGLLQSTSATPATTGAATSVTIPPAPTEPETSSSGASGTTSTTDSTAPVRTTRTASTTTKVPTANPTQVARTWNVRGGVVSVACTNKTISLLSASPADGWRVTIDSAGPDLVKLEFTSGEKETKVGGSCLAGVPQQSTTEHD
jgi:hypothetical protein